MRTVAIALALLTAACAGQPPLGPAVAEQPISHVAPEYDERAAFRALFCAVLEATEGEAESCDRFLWRDATEAAPANHRPSLGPLRHRWRVVLVSGYASDCFAPWAQMFGDARDRLAALGVSVLDAPIEGLSGAERNAALLTDYVLAEPEDPGQRTMLIGYSKGAADILEAVTRSPELAARIEAVVSVSGSLGGAQLAAAAPESLDALLVHAPGTACGPHDGHALWSLRPDVRSARLAAHPRPPRPPFYVLASVADRDSVSTALLDGWRTLSARGALTDGQLTVAEQTTPGAILLGHPRADHWAVALPLSTAMPTLAAAIIERNAFPRAALAEALLLFVDGQTESRRIVLRSNQTPPAR